MISILMHSKFRPRPSFEQIKVGDDLIPVSRSASNMGVLWMKHFLTIIMLRGFVSRHFVIWGIFLEFVNTCRKISSEVLIHALITTMLDDCNSLMYGLPKRLLSKLQSVQYSAARIVTLSRKCDHITPLFQLHWLPVHHRIISKIFLIVHKLMNGACPSYLPSCLQHRTSTPSLRSVTKELLSGLWQMFNTPIVRFVPILFNSSHCSPYS